jgi:CDP-diacylglycerol--glycerol-3-phosphate 3-phosphatidyltransferase
MIPIFVLFFFLKVVPFNYGIAAIIFIIAACTDFIDGYIARKYKLVTNLGKFLDPIADKVLVSTAMMLILVMKDDLFVTLGGAAEGVYIATAVCICVIMARELIISAFRQIAATKNLVMAADKLGKIKTTFQDISIFVIILAGGIAGFNNPTANAVPWDEYASYVLIAGLVLFAIATIFTVWSGISYVVKNRRVLKDETAE